MKRALDPIDRVSEVLFGLIMVLTFTGSLSVAEAGREDVRTMLIGALGCNLAWGIIDAVFYLMGCLAEKGRDLATFRAVREAGDPERGAAPHRGRVAAGGRVRPGAGGARRRAPAAAWSCPSRPSARGWAGDDWRGALGVFLLVFLSTFPVVIPFIVMRDAVPALRVSNAIAIVLLFVAGYAFGRLTGRHPVWMGIAMVVPRVRPRGPHHRAGRMTGR